MSLKMIIINNINDINNKNVSNLARIPEIVSSNVIHFVVNGFTINRFLAKDMREDTLHPEMLSTKTYKNN